MDEDVHLGKSGQECSVCQRDGVKKVEYGELHLRSGHAIGALGKKLRLILLPKSVNWCPLGESHLT